MLFTPSIVYLQIILMINGKEQDFSFYLICNISKNTSGCYLQDNLVKCSLKTLPWAQ